MFRRDNINVDFTSDELKELMKIYWEEDYDRVMDFIEFAYYAKKSNLLEKRAQNEKI